MGRLDGKVALVTGASRGIGEAIARRFVIEGAQVVNASTSEPAYDVVGIHFEHLDVRDPDQAKRVVDRVIERYDRLDILVNCAGIEIEKPVTATTLQEWDDVMAVNARGVFLMCKFGIEHLARTKGVIINIASINAHWAEPDLAVYSASKAAVLQLTKCMALDHASQGIRSVAICPGYVRTDMLEQYFTAQPEPAVSRAALERRHPLGRIGEPAEIAAMAAFLASDEASFISGHGYTVDGALTSGRTHPWG